MVEPSKQTGLRRIFRNTAWLLGGKAFAAIASLAYLAILSRSLGISGFGHFSLLLGTAQALVAIVGFQTWQTVVRFGAKHIGKGDAPAFGRLVFFSAGLDYLGALIGTLLSATIFFVFADVLELNTQYIVPGFLFTSVLLWARVSTPQGVVRVFDRFDAGTYIEAISPAGRLIASIAIALTGPTVIKFLIAWAAFDVLVSIIYWLAARSFAKDALRLGNLPSWRAIKAENPGIFSFFSVTYVNTTFDALTRQGPLLLVGALIGTSAAGVYRLADQLAQGVGKLANIVTRAVFPEFVQVEREYDAARFRKLTRDLTFMAGAGGVIVVGIALAFGEALLVLIGGEPFAVGAGILLALAIAAAFELAGLSYQPLLYATGFQRWSLYVRGLVLAITVTAIFSFRDYGGEGVGWAVALGSVVGYILSGIAVAHVFRLRKAQTRGEA